MIIGKIKNDKNAKNYLIDTKLVKIDKKYLLDYLLDCPALFILFKFHLDKNSLIISPLVFDC